MFRRGYEELEVLSNDAAKVLKSKNISTGIRVTWADENSEGFSVDKCQIGQVLRGENQERSVGYARHRGVKSKATNRLKENQWEGTKGSGGGRNSY